MKRNSREKLESYFVSMHVNNKDLDQQSINEENINKVLNSFDVNVAPHLVLPIVLSEKNCCK